jgi:hypothetical protein
MRQASSLLAFTLALLGCAPAIAPIAAEPTPPIAVASAPAAVPLVLGADAVDSDVRLRPPALDPFGRGAPTTFTYPAVTEISLADGARAQVVARPELPIVHVDLLLATTRTPASDLLCSSLLQSFTRPDHTLGTDLAAMGARVKARWCDVLGLHVLVDLAPVRLEPALVALVEALRDGEPTAAGLVDTRKLRLESIASDALRDPIPRLVDALLYPATDPAHDGPTPTAAALSKVTLAEITRARAARRPDQLTLTIVGDVALPELRSALDRVAARWPAPTDKRALHGSPPAPSSPPHGAFFVEDFTRKDVEIGLTYPVPSIASAETPALFAVVYALDELWRDRDRKGEAAPFHLRQVRPDIDARGGLLRITADAPIGGAAPALKAMLADLAAVGAEQLTEPDAQTLRSWLSGDLARSFDGGTAVADKLNYLGPRASIADDERFFRGLATLDAQAPAAFAKKWLAPEHLLFVAVGPVTEEKVAVEALGLGKVKILPAPAKGASK